MLIGLVCAAAQGVISMGTAVSIGLDSREQMEHDRRINHLSFKAMFASKIVGSAFLAIPSVAGAVYCVFALF